MHFVTDRFSFTSSLYQSATKAANWIAPETSATRFVCTKLIPPAAKAITASAAIYAGLRYAVLPFGHTCISILKGSEHHHSMAASFSDRMLEAMEDYGGAMAGVTAVCVAAGALAGIALTIHQVYSNCNKEYTTWVDKEVENMETGLAKKG